MRSTAAALAIVLAVAPAIARAQPIAGPDLIALGPDAAVRRITGQCWYDVAALCSWWQPEGNFSFGGLTELEVATTFARTPSGRVFAMTPAGSPAFSVTYAPTYPVVAGVLYTDDLGATWARASWPDTHAHARAFAFDPHTGYAVAVGDAGIWSSDDDGVTWRRRRSSSGTVYARAWVRGRTVIVADARGALWISRDGGFALETLADHGTAEERGDEVAIVAGDRRWRLDRHGGLHRE